MRKSVIAVLPLTLLCGVFADGSAHAECAPEDKIYIDPRLVPRQRSVTREQFQAIMNAPGISPEIKAQVQRALLQQGQPIVVPYGTGKVLVHPTNPCIQQYIP